MRPVNTPTSAVCSTGVVTPVGFSVAASVLTTNEDVTPQKARDLVAVRRR